MVRRANQARIEVLAQRAEILTKLQAGYSVRSIWADLRESGRVSVALSSFYERVADIAPRPATASVSISSSPPPSTFQAHRIDDSGRLPAFAFDGAAPRLDLRPADDSPTPTGAK